LKFTKTVHLPLSRFWGDVYLAVLGCAIVTHEYMARLRWEQYKHDTCLLLEYKSPIENHQHLRFFFDLIICTLKVDFASVLHFIDLLHSIPFDLTTFAKVKYDVAFPYEMADLRGSPHRIADIDVFSESEVEKSVAYGRKELTSVTNNQIVKLTVIAPDIAMVDLSSLEIDPVRIYSRESVLGEGAFGKVFKGASLYILLLLLLFLTVFVAILRDRNWATMANPEMSIIALKDYLLTGPSALEYFFFSHIQY
jgi:hypothetical protein